MEIRSDYELIVKVINCLRCGYKIHIGLCHFIKKLSTTVLYDDTTIISNKESKRLIQILNDNKPVHSFIEELWWPEGEKEPRLEFLEDLKHKYV